MLRRIWCNFWYFGHEWETVYGQQDTDEFGSIVFSAHVCSRCNHTVVFDLEPVR